MQGYREGHGILTMFEAEAYVNALSSMDLDQVGSEKYGHAIYLAKPKS